MLLEDDHFRTEWVSHGFLFFSLWVCGLLIRSVWQLVENKPSFYFSLFFRYLLLINTSWMFLDEGLIGIKEKL